MDRKSDLSPTHKPGSLGMEETSSHALGRHRGCSDQGMQPCKKEDSGIGLGALWILDIPVKDFRSDGQATERREEKNRPNDQDDVIAEEDVRG